MAVEYRGAPERSIFLAFIGIGFLLSLAAQAILPTFLGLALTSPWASIAVSMVTYLVFGLFARRLPPVRWLAQKISPKFDIENLQIELNKLPGDVVHATVKSAGLVEVSFTDRHERTREELVEILSSCVGCVGDELESTAWVAEHPPIVHFVNSKSSSGVHFAVSPLDRSDVIASSIAFSLQVGESFNDDVDRTNRLLERYHALAVETANLFDLNEDANFHLHVEIDEIVLHGFDAANKEHNLLVDEQLLDDPENFYQAFKSFLAGFKSPGNGPGGSGDTFTSRLPDLVDGAFELGDDIIPDPEQIMPHRKYGL